MRTALHGRRLAGRPMSERERTDQPISTESAERLVALLDTGAIDRRRYTMVNRLRRLHDSDHFATLPEDLRRRIREIVADSAR